MKKYIAASLFLIGSLTFVEGKTTGGGPSLFSQDPSLEVNPWLTGPLLAPSSHNVPYGHVNIEPYLYWTQYRGIYDNNWKFAARHHFTVYSLSIPFQIGILPSTEFDITPQVYYSYSQGQSSLQFADLPLALSFQLLNDQPGKPWPPAIKLRFGANAPTGKFDHLKPSKQGTDQSGIGSWAPSVGLVFGNLFHISGPHFFALRYFFNYTIPAGASVRGSNIYGGTTTTRGTIYPGAGFTANIGLEYSLSQPWTLALDILYEYEAKNRFSGYDGGAPMTSPSSASYSLAPAIEYNFSDSIGLIGGSWFTVAGRNTAQYINFVLALNVYI